jgi:predicted PurR-regulated permease PerM
MINSEDEAPGEAIAVNTDTSATELVRIRRLLLLIFLMAAFTAVYFARDVLLPIVLAIVLTLTLLPVIRTGERLHIPRPVTAIALIATMAVSLFLAGYFLSGPIGQMVEDAPEIASELEEKFRGIMEGVSSIQEATQEVTDAAADAAAQAGGAPAGSEPEPVVVVADETDNGSSGGVLGAAVGGLASASGSVFAALLLTLFLLSSGDFYHRRIVEAAPRLRDKVKALTIIRDVERQISRYLGAIFAINLGLGLVVGTTLWFLGMPMAVVWGVLAFLLNFIPYVGNLLTVGLVGAVALVSYDTVWEALLPPIAVIVLSGIESNVFTPIAVGRRLELNQVSQLIMLAFWTWLWGVPGAILAVPFLVVVKAVCDNVDSLQTLGSFLSGDPGTRGGEVPQKATTGPALDTAPLRTQAEAREDSPPTRAPGEERVTPLVAE